VSDPEVRARWAGGAEFAEFAEALGVQTDRIMAASVLDERRVIALYTPDDPFEPDHRRADPRIFQARLLRDDEHVLRRHSERELPGFWAMIVEHVEGRLADGELRRRISEVGGEFE
jgi:hypothetical protein